MNEKTSQNTVFSVSPVAYRICTNERGRCHNGICTLFGNCYGICDVSLTGARKRIEKTNTYAPPAGRGGRPVLGRVRGALGVPGDLYRADRGCRIPPPTFLFFLSRARARERERGKYDTQRTRPRGARGHLCGIGNEAQQQAHQELQSRRACDIELQLQRLRARVHRALHKVSQLPSRGKLSLACVPPYPLPPTAKDAKGLTISLFSCRLSPSLARALE